MFVLANTCNTRNLWAQYKTQHQHRSFIQNIQNDTKRFTEYSKGHSGYNTQAMQGCRILLVWSKMDASQSLHKSAVHSHVVYKMHTTVSGTDTLDAGELCISVMLPQEDPPVSISQSALQCIWLDGVPASGFRLAPAAHFVPVSLSCLRGNAADQHAAQNAALSVETALRIPKRVTNKELRDKF